MLEAAHIGSSARHDAFLASHGLARLDPAAAERHLPAGVTHLSLQFHGEHCTECAAPDCHTTCDLFERGAVGRCRRFQDGIVVRPLAGGAVPYTMEILFKPWGQVICVGNAGCMPLARHRRWARVLAWAGRASYLLQCAFRPLPMRLHWRIADRIRGLGNRLPRLLNRLARRANQRPAEVLLCVIGNPAPEPVQVELSVSGFGASQGGRSFRRVVDVPRGWRVVEIPVTDIARVIDLRGLFRICLVPLIDKPAFLQLHYFGFASGGTATAPAAEPKGGVGKKVKVLVTDLDNTLWNGILIENPDRIPDLLPGRREVLRELDRRGILLSVASKNNPADAQRVLERHGIWDLFLHPQIGWEPKSAGIRTLVQRLNVGMDTVAFIDDMEFEREEVRAALPDVRTWDAGRFPELPALGEFNVPVTPDSQERRRMYQQEQSRQSSFGASGLEYSAFLYSCGIRLVLGPLTAENRERVYELVQRTNQLNFSGTRYSREDLLAIEQAGETIPVVMRCEDRYGSYGIVGFSILRRAGDALEMADLMLSCRIQGKQVEHSFLAHLHALAAAAGLAALVCRFTPTERNGPAGRVFAEMPFEHEEAGGGRQLHRLAASQSLARYPATVVDAVGIAKRLA
jgi:FkbH-like protein